MHVDGHSDQKFRKIQRKIFNTYAYVVRSIVFVVFVYFSSWKCTQWPFEYLSVQATHIYMYSLILIRNSEKFKEKSLKQMYSSFVYLFSLFLYIFPNENVLNDLFWIIQILRKQSMCLVNTYPSMQVDARTDQKFWKIPRKIFKTNTFFIVHTSTYSYYWSEAFRKI